MALNEQTTAEIQDLAWKMADDAVSAEDIQRLEELLLADADARLLYVQCMQLQADLHLFFNPKPAITQPPVAGALGAIKPTPVLTSLPTIGPASTPTSV